MAKPKQRLRWRLPQTEFTAHTYFITLDQAYQVKQVRERPAHIPEDQDSLLVHHFDPSNLELSLAFHITWLDGKPEPNTRERKRGLLAVYRWLLSLVDPKTRQALSGTIGIGHADDASWEWTK